MPRFASIDKTKDAVGKNANERFAILKEYNMRTARLIRPYLGLFRFGIRSRVPRAAYLASRSVNRIKPWVAEGIHRATWYRRKARAGLAQWQKDIIRCHCELELLDEGLAVNGGRTRQQIMDRLGDIFYERLEEGDEESRKLTIGARHGTRKSANPHGTKSCDKCGAKPERDVPTSMLQDNT